MHGLWMLLGKQWEGMLCSAETSPRDCCLAGRRENTLPEYRTFNKSVSDQINQHFPHRTQAVSFTSGRLSGGAPRSAARGGVRKPRVNGKLGVSLALSRAGWDCGSCQGGGAAAATATALPVRAPPRLRAGRSRGVLSHPPRYVTAGDNGGFGYPSPRAATGHSAVSPVLGPGCAA